MKARFLCAAIGMSIALGAPTLVAAQSTIQAKQKQAAKTTPAAKTTTAPIRRSGLPASLFDQDAAVQKSRDSILRSGLPAAYLDQHDQGEGFTSSSMRGMTVAGTIGVETGTMGSDVNGQIGTTNQDNMVHGMPSGVFVSHFGSGGSGKTAKPKAHRSPKPKNTNQSDH